MNYEVNEARIEWLHDQLLKISCKIDDMNDLLHKRVNNRKEEIEEVRKQIEKVRGTAEHSAGVWSYVWHVVKFILTAASGVAVWVFRGWLTK